LESSRTRRRKRLIESFCIHARNLNEFFLENGKDDTLKASSFATNDYKRPNNAPERRSLFAKINKQISHLTEAPPRTQTGSGEEPENRGCYNLIAAHGLAAITCSVQKVPLQKANK